MLCERALTGATAGHAEPAPSSGYVEEVYSYVASPKPPHGARDVMVLFKFSTTLRNRATSVDGGGQQSVAFPGARCFSINAGALGHKLGPKGRPATRGSKHTLTVTRYRGGDRSRPVTVAASFKIRRQGSRADAAKQLGC